MVTPSPRNLEPMDDKQKVTDHKARTIFYTTIKKSGLDDIMNCKTAKEIWETLCSSHTKFELWHSVYMVKDFVCMEKKADEGVEDYLARRTAEFHRVRDTGFDFTDAMQAAFAITGLPPEFADITRGL